MDIAKLIAQKRDTIKQLQDEIRQLEKAQLIIEGVSGKKAKPRRGAKKAAVLKAVTRQPQRMSVIAKAAGVSTPDAASVLQAALRQKTVKKGKDRGTYLLA